MSSLTSLAGRWKREDSSYHADEGFRNKTEEGCDSYGYGHDSESGFDE